MDYTYTIIDSNAASKLQLQLYMREYGDFNCVGTDTNAEDGLNGILKFAPDLVLINLNEEGMAYFHMVSELNQFLNNLPIIVGYSTSKKYAYNAIKSGFFDYWILPHNEFDVRKTIMRLRKRFPKHNVPSTLCLKSYNDYRYLNTSEIMYLKSDNNSTDFFMSNGNVVSAFKTLKSFEEQLPQSFIRIHQSYILNSRYVGRINYGKSICTLRNKREDELPFSKTYREKVDGLKEMLSKTAINTYN
ncbi:LytR/AlgR family response regulator transcription factor [Flagellimonas myxillae]|uniref:LytR/AlgR family response regulator transcription factor n=1 Tax=Flagellimonas myxillae TaxID=2942214 RepID=UPI00201F8882|nr:LytTR family DNA-binding domain-containing protein [Muricauda myxillae]MCL6265705.1 LytTR family DNA-binding domain-containing protein [Muricauda myxillae]